MKRSTGIRVVVAGAGLLLIGGLVVQRLTSRPPEPTWEEVSLSEWLLLLERGTPEERGLAARGVGALAEQSEGRALPALIGALSDVEADVRLEVIKAIRRLRWPAFAPALPRLIACAGDDDLNVRFQILWMLDELGPEGGASGRAAATARIGAEQSVKLREYAAFVAGKLGVGHPETVAALAKAVGGDQAPRVRKAAAEALGDMAQEAAAAAGALRMALEEDPRFDVQQACAIALRSLGGAEAVDVEALLDLARRRRCWLHVEASPQLILGLLAAAAPPGVEVVVGELPPEPLRLDARGTWDELLERVVDAARLTVVREGSRIRVGQGQTQGAEGHWQPIPQGPWKTGVAAPRFEPGSEELLRNCVKLTLAGGQQGVLYPPPGERQAALAATLDAVAAKDTIVFVAETVEGRWLASDLLTRRAGPP